MNTRTRLLVGLVSLVTFALGAWASHSWGSLIWSDGDGMDKGMDMSGDAKVDRDRKVLYWKSAMVAGEVHQEPGQDSMGMDLIPVYEGDDVGPGKIRIDPVTQLNIGVRLGDVTVGPLTKTVRTVGFVDYDETTLGAVTTKIDGWIEKLYVDETGVQVHAGDPLFELYSPTLFSAQEEYLVALRNLQVTDVSIVPRSRLDSEGLLKDARTRLEYFDISDELIDEIKSAGVARKSLTLHSPFTGIVTHKSIVEGQRVLAGQDLFRVADLSRVWVIGRVFEYDLPFVHVGQEARMSLSYIPGKTFVGKVAYVYPFLEKGTREISVRMEFFNPGYELKPGMYATIELDSQIESAATLIPDVAVMDTGERSVTFVSTAPGRFELREIRTGLRSGDHQIQILSGLEVGERVVLSGQFLLDSESRLREAALKFLEPEAPPKASEGSRGGGDDAEQTSEEAGRAKLTAPSGPPQYVCPMPEHRSVLYDDPGDCPICGQSMELVPSAGGTSERADQGSSDGR